MPGAAYVALRASGPRYRLLLTSVLGGFVSRTAMVAVMGPRAVDEPPMCRLATAAEVSSSVATVVLLAAVIGAASIRVPPEMALPLILASVAATATQSPSAYVPYANHRRSRSSTVERSVCRSRFSSSLPLRRSSRSRAR